MADEFMTHRSVEGPRVSLITPTYERRAFLEASHRCVSAQTYRNWEWLILDDSAEPCRFLQHADARNIHYAHVSSRLSIGEKRNKLIEAASGEIIVQIDDDDYYAPQYVQAMVAALHGGADIVNLNAWFLLDRRNHFFGYWDLLMRDKPSYRCSPDAIELVTPTLALAHDLSEAHFGFGFTYAFWRRVWEAGRFPDKNWNEDGEFVAAARRRFTMVGAPDRQGLCLHVIHAGNSSRCFPQYRLPYFLVERFFPGYSG
ncbi:MAG: glycosyltransferase family A protein [Alphaproteobacteria bacterium]